MNDLSTSDHDDLLRLSRSYRDHFEELDAWMERSEHDPALHSYLHGEILRRKGQFTSALPLLEQARDLFERGERRTWVMEANRKIGTCYQSLRDYPNALEVTERSLGVAIAMQDEEAVALSHQTIGLCLSRQGDVGQALEHFMQSAEYFEQVHNDRGLASVLGNIGMVYGLAEDYEKAQSCFHRSIDHAVRSDDLNRELSARYNLAIIHFQLGTADVARQEYERLIAIADQHGKVRASNMARLALANCDLSANDGPVDAVSAERRLRMLLDSDLDDETRAEEPDIKVLLAECVGRQGRHDEALALVAEAQGDPGLSLQRYCHCYFIRGTIASLEGRLDEALRAFEHALERARAHNLRGLEHKYLVELRELARKRGAFEEYVTYNTLASEIERARRLSDASRKVALQEKEREIAAERQERERERAVLYSTLPAHVADRVIRGEDVSGDDIDEAAVLFMDIVGFTTLSSSMSPKDVTILLDEVFSICDTEVARHGVTRIKTIGDSYMAVAFPDIESPSPARRAVQAAVAIRQRLAEAKPDIAVRIGLHVGPVVAGVIGKDHLQYDVWGDTVNMASRMESTAEPGRIQVSAEFHEQLSKQAGFPVSDLPFPKFTERGRIDVKGKGLVETYWVEW